MQRSFMVAALIAPMVLGESPATKAEVYAGDIVVCQPFPAWYPRSWELMVRRPCLIYYRYYSPDYDLVSHHRLRPRHLYDATPHVHYRHEHRPYLRPGWWW